MPYSLPLEIQGVSLSASLTILLGTLTLVLVYSIFTRTRPAPGIPVVALEDTKTKSRWSRGDPYSFLRNGREIVNKGLSECAGCFQVLTTTGYKVIVPNRFADELKAHPDLNFNEAFRTPFTHWPGFDAQAQALQDDWFIQQVVRIKLTQSLGLVTDALVDEAIASSHDTLGQGQDWNTIRLKEVVLDVVARLSSRVFLGKDFARNRSWLEISKNYTVDTFAAQAMLRAIPPLLRRPFHWYNSTCVRLRQHVKTSRELITPEVEARRKKAQEAAQAGRKAVKESDAIAWMVDVAKDRKVDYVAAQLSLTVAAIHTTTEMTVNCMLQLCETPEVVEPLRAEVISVLSENGWSKTSLYKLKLMDSFMKEVQRMHGLATMSMNRMVKKPITLSDGTCLPKGVKIMISDDKPFDSNTYTDPNKFDVARFLNLREQPGEENRHQFVTTTPEHMAFGHGQHACPGRFFAANEIKIFLCILLLSYDIRFLPGEKRKKPLEFEVAMMVDPSSDIQVKHRTPEVDLSNPMKTHQ